MKKNLLRILTAIIIITASCAGQRWYDYRTCIVSGDGEIRPSYIRPIIKPTTESGHNWIQVSIEFRTMYTGNHHGGAGGEWWVFYDMNPRSRLSGLYSGPVMDMSSPGVDIDIYSPMTGQMTVLQPTSSEVYQFIFGWTYHIASMVQLSPQAGGSRFVVDMHSWQPLEVPIARVQIPPGISFLYPEMDIHIIGNLDTELDGAGWVYIHETVQTES